VPWSDPGTVPTPIPTITGYRVAGYDTPLWVNPNRTPGRYNGPGAPPTQYLCGHPAGPWAELLRFHDERDPAAVATLRTRLWAVRVPEPILEITFANAHLHGIHPKDLVDDDWTACQALATRVHADPTLPDTLCVPSAALPGTVNYVILGPRIAVPFDALPLDEEDLSTAHAAEDARALDTMLGLVCFRGQPHAGYVKWSNGDVLAPLAVPVPR
jgi:RES domain-containing protein